MDHEASIISENTLIDHEALERELRPENFKTYGEFLTATKYDSGKASKMWTDMIAERDKWPLI